MIAQAKYYNYKQSWQDKRAFETPIKEELHLQYEFYSKKLQILADALFIKQCYQNDILTYIFDKLVGDCKKMLRVHLLTKSGEWLQYIILQLKLALSIMPI